MLTIRITNTVTDTLNSTCGDAPVPLNKAFMQKIVGARAVRYIIDNSDGSTTGLMEKKHLTAVTVAYKKELDKYTVRSDRCKKHKKD